MFLSVFLGVYLELRMPRCGEDPRPAVDSRDAQAPLHGVRTGLVISEWREEPLPHKPPQAQRRWLHTGSLVWT